MFYHFINNIFQNNLNNNYDIYPMKEKFFFGIIGGISIIATSIPIYNYYLLPIIRHKEMMDKIDGFDKRLKKLEK
jgi:hypothetical protein